MDDMIRMALQAVDTGTQPPQVSVPALRRELEQRAGKRLVWILALLCLVLLLASVALMMMLLPPILAMLLVFCSLFLVPLTGMGLFSITTLALHREVL